MEGTTPKPLPDHRWKPGTGVPENYGVSTPPERWRTQPPRLPVFRQQVWYVIADDANYPAHLVCTGRYASRIEGFNELYRLFTTRGGVDVHRARVFLDEESARAEAAVLEAFGRKAPEFPIDARRGIVLARDGELKNERRRAKRARDQRYRDKMKRLKKLALKQQGEQQHAEDGGQGPEDRAQQKKVRAVQTGGPPTD